MNGEISSGGELPVFTLVEASTSQSLAIDTEEFNRTSLSNTKEEILERLMVVLAENVTLKLQVKYFSNLLEKYTQDNLSQDSLSKDHDTNTAKTHEIYSFEPIVGEHYSSKTEENVQDQPETVVDTKTQNKNRIYQCEVCSKIFKKLRSLKKHKLSCSEDEPDAVRTPQRDKSHKCGVCGKFYTSRSNLRHHKKIIHHVDLCDTNDTFRCSICDIEFNDSVEFQKHKKTHRDRTKNMCDCPQCGKLFSRKAQMNVHIKNVHIRKDRVKTICDICGTSVMDIKKHGMIHDTTDAGRPHKCTMCNHRSRTKRALDDHMLVHTKERPFCCYICGMRIQTASYLKEHLLIHTDEKPFKCDTCGKNFMSTKRLKRHELTHTDVKPYDCGVCEKKFRSRGHLRDHLLTHSGQRPYSCTMCGKQFVQGAHRNTHMRLVHGVSKQKEVRQKEVRQKEVRQKEVRRVADEAVDIQHIEIGTCTYDFAGVDEQHAAVLELTGANEVVVEESMTLPHINYVAETTDGSALNVRYIYSQEITKLNDSDH